MTIPESQLEKWSRQGAKVTSAATYEAISKVLNDPKSSYHVKSFRTSLQGSYGNDTNIYKDSDVDVTMCLTSIYYMDTSDLSPDDKERFERNRGAATYSFEEFRKEVLSWLIKNFGTGVKLGKKAIFIPGHGSRRDADVLVCVEHRKYWSYAVPNSTHFSEGICFWTTDGKKIVNYPKQHMANCTTKHQGTNSRFKCNIRALKNMRNAMIERKFLEEGVAPSYFLEGMLWNAPNENYVSTYRQAFLNYINWLDSCETSKLLCANERHWLLRDNSQVSWSLANFKKFRNAAVGFWNSYENLN
ncbi:nucleotidyltransferase domain-containing protein [Paenirhodobacter populi]|uniref:Nucleotidyltransferase n=1 Tax=Paenirhodobacter populi TaxID=2306993 RepID=A0A451GCT6_9RHOB|nr:nucleotidyltransferase [Sinirhodobacter populi]RWR13240.1 nucleotidyltransferase [Sinirhodobacter populi]